jgi:hypothetical protein
MAGLEHYDRIITQHCNDVIETATKVRDLQVRDPEQVRLLGNVASRKLGEVTEAVYVVAKEGAFGELEALRKKQSSGPDICLEVSV